MPDTLTPIDFWFDFSSPYGYLMSEKIDALAAQYGRKVRWHPILLGIVFKATGSAPLTLQNPAKAEYSLRDFARSARFMGIPYHQPDKFPLATQNAARAYYWLHAQDCALAQGGGDVVPKRTLAQRLEPLGDPMDTAALQVHISNLRRKIGAERVGTLRGVGYWLESV